MFAERPVGFELFLAEELIEGRLVRKLRIGLLVGDDVVALVAAQRCLDVDQRALLALAARCEGRVADRSEGDMGARLLFQLAVLDFIRDSLGAYPDRLPVQLDYHVHINSREALDLDQRSRIEVGVGFAVDRDDQFAAPSQQFVNAEIVDVAAIGQKDEATPLLQRLGVQLLHRYAGLRERLVQQVARTRYAPELTLSLFLLFFLSLCFLLLFFLFCLQLRVAIENIERMPDPAAEPNIQQRDRRRQRPYRGHSHVRRGGGA